MRKKMLFIYNPTAGKGKIKSKLSDIIEIFVDGGYEVTIYSTTGKQDAKRLTEELAEQYDLVVCSGGDGTLNEVTDGLMLCEKRPPCGYLPTGTVNDFASTLKISKDMKKAAYTAIHGIEFPYDIGSFNADEFFTYIAAFGAFTDVSYETPQATKNILGKMAYFLEGVKRVPTLKSYHMVVEADDITIEDDFIFGMISNSNSIGGFKNLGGSDVLLDDGFFEAAFIKMPKNPLELQSIINALLLREINNKFIYSFLAKELKIVSNVIVPWTLDGEFGGEMEEVFIKNNHKAIKYMKDPDELKEV